VLLCLMTAPVVGALLPELLRSSGVTVSHPHEVAQSSCIGEALSGSLAARRQAHGGDEHCEFDDQGTSGWDPCESVCNVRYRSSIFRDLPDAERSDCDRGASTPP
jgi:hypothetical protein